MTCLLVSGSSSYTLSCESSFDLVEYMMKHKCFMVFDPFIYEVLRPKYQANEVE